jgi:hypothetical protein
MKLAQADPALKASAFEPATWLLSREEFLARFPVKFLVVVPATDRETKTGPVCSVLHQEAPLRAPYPAQGK